MAINTKRYRSKDLNIPFYESNTKLHKVKLKVDKITSQEDFIDRRTTLIESALDEFIILMISGKLWNSQRSVRL